MFRELVEVIYYLGDVFFISEPRSSFTFEIDDLMLEDLHLLKKYRLNFFKYNESPKHQKEVKELWKQQGIKVMTNIFAYHNGREKAVEAQKQIEKKIDYWIAYSGKMAAKGERI